MFARVTTVQIYPEKRPLLPSNVDESVQLWKDKAADIIRNRQGFVAALVLLDRRNSQVKVTTLWETEEDMNSIEAEGVYSTVLNSFADLAPNPPQMERFEVGDFIRADGPADS